MPIETRTRVCFLFMLLFSLIILFPSHVMATQVHDRPEGLFAHQMAHVFFTVSMILFVYWLKTNRFVERTGWRLIQCSAILFVLWNLDAMFVHWMAGRIDSSFFVGSQMDWSRKLIVRGRIELVFFYLAKMDHLLCVPAMILLYLGIRKLKNDPKPLIGATEEESDKAIEDLSQVYAPLKVNKESVKS